MKRSQNIEISRLVVENQSLRSQLAFYMNKAENSVSRDEYDAKQSECDALRNELEITQNAIKQNEELYKTELAALNNKLKEYEEAQALLKTENADFKTLWEFWQRHHFGVSSETMTDMMDKVVGELPKSKVAMYADIMSMVDRLNHSNVESGEIKLPVVDSEGTAAKKREKSRKTDGRSVSGRNHKKTKCLDVREVLGPDFSNLPPGFKVIIRKGKPETIKIEIIFMQKSKTYSKIFTIMRCNVPGEDPQYSKYPSRLFGKVPVDPVFASFFLEMKFGYNIPESRILEMLEKAGCIVPQATLNRWMHTVIEGLKEVLLPEMEKAIKESRFTHNDETRILVRSKEKEEEKSSYNTEYIHGILSPEVKLFVMLYKKGSRSHEVQMDIFKDSNIIAFLADRCPLYTALITALNCHPLIRGACWVHFRRYLLHAYLQDKRLEIMVHLIARLFAAERILSGMKLTDTQRVRERQRMCRPLVEAIFSFMEKVRDGGTEYGVLAHRAADYLLNDKEGFSAFLTCGLIEIGNNAVERCFRNIAKGRENWLQCGSHQAAEHTAFMYSLVESCKMNDLDFGLYIETVLKRIQNGDTDYAGMLPNRIILTKEVENTSVA